MVTLHPVQTFFFLVFICFPLNTFTYFLFILYACFCFLLPRPHPSAFVCDTTVLSSKLCGCLEHTDTAPR